jgi:hypothetical protein
VKVGPHATLPAVPISPGHHHLRSVPDRYLHQLQRPLDPRRPPAAGHQPDPRTLPHRPRTLAHGPGAASSQQPNQRAHARSPRIAASASRRTPWCSTTNLSGLTRRALTPPRGRAHPEGPERSGGLDTDVEPAATHPHAHSVALCDKAASLTRCSPAPHSCRKTTLRTHTLQYLQCMAHNDAVEACRPDLTVCRLLQLCLAPLANGRMPTPGRARTRPHGS